MVDEVPFFRVSHHFFAKMNPLNPTKNPGLKKWKVLNFVSYLQLGSG